MDEKMPKSKFIVLAFSLLLLSCSGNRKIKDSSKKIQEYSLFPQGVILAGKISDEKTFYLVRKDAETMKGFCLVDNNQAVVEIIDFWADSTGVTAFMYGNNVHFGKMIVNKPSMKIEVTLPQISRLDIEPQTIELKYFNKIPEEVDCPEYYKNRVFENITTMKDIQYGTALGYYSSKPIDHISKNDYRQWFSELFKTSLVNKGFLIKYDKKQLPLCLDIYLPETGNLNKRPLLFFIHGGAFFFGDKENKMQQSLTEYFVKRGYVVASINYRLGTKLTLSAIKETIYYNVQDARAALRFLVHHKEQFGIDEEQVYLSGSSAGGFISLTTAFMDSDEIYAEAKGAGGLDDLGEYQDSFGIAGVVSLWGGVTDLQILNNHIPTLLFHGKEDDIVPCDEGLPFKKLMGDIVYSALSTCFGKIYGSEPIYNRLQSLNIPVTYYPFHDGGHELHIEADDELNENMNIICEEMGDFLYSNVSRHYFDYDLSGDTIVGKYDFVPIYELNNIGTASIQWQVEGGIITGQKNNAIRVIWYSTHKAGMVTACITNKNGDSCKKVLNVKIN